MATKLKPAPAPEATTDRDEITTAKMYRSEARALAIIADAYDISQPDALREFLGEALNAKAREALDKQRAELTAAKRG